MLATIMPFACMGLGLLIGFQKLPQAAYRAVDWVTTISLVILMITIGGNVGTNKEVIAEIGYDSETDIENPADSVFCSHGAGFVVKWDKVYDHMHIDGIKLDQDDDEEQPHRPS